MTLLTKISISLMAFLSANILLAQGAPPATPIDGGLSVLLAAGGIYGLKKLKERKQEQI